MKTQTQTLLSIKGLTIDFIASENTSFRAVQGVDFDFFGNQITAIVGESGCGKSVSMKAVTKLLDDNAKVQCSSIFFNSTALHLLSDQEMNEVRGKKISYVFQEPADSFDPLFTIEYQMKEVMRSHDMPVDRKDLIKHLEAVRITDAGRALACYPHELSGGTLQRIAIAIAIMTRPPLIIADEPTTALDVTIQAQILTLLKNINKENGTSIILISHDLNVVYESAARVYVMYAGRVVENASTSALFKKPLHPYTALLIQSIPSPLRNRLVSIPGSVPDMRHLPKGCPFHPRCPIAEPVCAQILPELKDDGNGRLVRCHKPGCYPL